MSSNKVFSIHIDQVIEMIDVIPPTNKEAFTDLYVAYDLMETDLKKVLEDPNLSEKLTDELCKV